MNEEVNEIIVPKFFDAHAHLREREVEYDLLSIVLKEIVKYCFGAVVMPNINSPVCDIEAVDRYYKDIREVLERRWISYRYSPSDFQPLMTVQLTDIEKQHVCKTTTPKIIEEAYKGGVKAAKSYPAGDGKILPKGINDFFPIESCGGITTNASIGVSNFCSHIMHEVWKKMEEVGMIALFHPEEPGVFCMDKEEEFFTTIEWLADKYPKLKIVMEHITTAKAVEFVEEMPDTVRATIPAKYLIMTLNDVIGGKLHPHNFCHSIPKRPEDRDALIEAAISGDKSFFWGEDSAAHLRENKECAFGSAGVYSGPLAPSILAKVFTKYKAVDKIKDFTSTFASQFYSITPSDKTIKIVKEDWTVPKSYDGIVPFLAGLTVDWRLAD